jgi:hypothetical protein
MPTKTHAADRNWLQLGAVAKLIVEAGLHPAALQAPSDNCCCVSQHAMPPVLTGKHSSCTADAKMATQLMLLLHKLAPMLWLWYDT